MSIELRKIVSTIGMNLINKDHYKTININGYKRCVKIETVKLVNGLKLKMYDVGISQGRLSQDQVIQGINFAAHTEVNFKPNGKLFWAKLFQDQEILGGIKGKAGTCVHFLETGGIQRIFLSQETLIQGIKFKEDTQIVFYHDGKLLYAILSQPHEIGGHKCDAGKTIVF
jgi:hypothetical protein